MKIKVISLSPQGQFTIPSSLRHYLKAKKYVLEIRDDVIVLKPCRMMMKSKDSFVNKALLDKILNLEGICKEVFNIIRKEPCSADMVFDELNLPISQIGVALSQLEFAELIRKNEFFLWETTLDEP